MKYILLKFDPFSMDKKDKADEKPCLTVLVNTYLVTSCLKITNTNYSKNVKKNSHGHQH